MIVFFFFSLSLSLSLSVRLIMALKGYQPKGSLTLLKVNIHCDDDNLDNGFESLSSLKVVESKQSWDEGNLICVLL